ATKDAAVTAPAAEARSGGSAEAPRPKSSRGSDVASQSSLLSRIKRLERDVNTLAAKGTLSSPNAALKMLEKYRGEALDAENDPQLRRELVVKLNGFERIFLKR
ncbi:hypothetical protein ACLESO_52825, partial [Pyxidicoccus sp. 3LG]